jgi:hypothetical protein
MSTCRSCDKVFFGPKRALCCHACYLDGQERRKQGEAAYDEEHKGPQYAWNEASLAVYREGWITGWVTAKYPKP